jgi:selenocysteine lyase/cysteine desulfurase
MSYISLKGLEVSIQEILKIGIENIDNHSQKLKRYFVSILNESNFQTFHQKNISTSSHIVSIFNPNINISRVTRLLSENNIFCSIRNSYLRVSFAHYNNQSDIDKLLSILKED